MPPKIKPVRPTFHITDFTGDKIEIKAGGVVFFKEENGMYFLLLINNDGKYEDFGGCTDDQDKDILDTISREVEEESNMIFERSNIRKRIEKLNMFVNEKSKYVFYTVPLTKTEKKLKPKDFGDHETYDDIDRTIEWIHIGRFKDQSFMKSLNFRLKTADFFAFIRKLKNAEDTGKKLDLNSEQSSDSESENQETSDNEDQEQSDNENSKNSSKEKNLFDD